VPAPVGAPPAVQTQVVLSDSTHKIFLLFEQYGVGTFGAAFVDEMPIAHHIEQFQAAAGENPPASAQILADQLLAYFRAKNPIPNLFFIVVGYDGTVPWVLDVNVAANSTQRWNVDVNNNVSYGIVRGGDTAIVNRLLSQPEFNPPFNVMNTQDAIDYSRHLIRTTIDQMRFEPRFATVGGAIDTLVLRPGVYRFLSRKELHP
jgi:hypothetical protein